MSGCRISLVKFKDGRSPVKIVPRAYGSEVLEELHEVLEKAREVEATEYMIVLRGWDGQNHFRASSVKDRYGQIGYLFELMLMMAGAPDE